MFDLTGKVALVIGGQGRLGSTFCQALQDSGAEVISADMNLDNTDADVTQLHVDVSDKASIKKLISTIIDKKKQIDIFVYSVTAKTDDSYMPYTDVSLEGWKRIIDIELNGLFMLTQEVGKVMERQKSGAMIFISSIYGIVANDHRIYEDSNLGDVYAKSSMETKKIFSPAVYNVVKAGVISLSRYLAAYWGTSGIRVNCISPGGIEHPDENDAFVKKYSEKLPMARKAKLNEMNGALIYLASDASSYVTGHNLVVDGGWTTW